MKTLWEQAEGTDSKQDRQRRKLTEERYADVAVVGAGMAGILTAWLLQKEGFRVIVLEAAEAGSGQTGRTTAKITAQHGMKYYDLIQTAGLEKAKQYADANIKAIEKYEDMIREEHIECNFERLPAFLYAEKDDFLLKREFEAEKKAGLQAVYVTESELPFSIAGGICLPDQAQFHPLKFLEHLAGKLEIYENTPVWNLIGGRVVTPLGSVTAKYTVIATHYPIWNFPGMYFTRMHQERSYVIGLRKTQPLHGMYLGVEEDSLSLRSYGDILLLGGGKHRTGENPVGGQYDSLRKKALAYWQDCEEVCRWSAQDVMTVDHLPYVGKYSFWKSRCYVAAGFEKWGMTGSMAAAELLRNFMVQAEERRPLWKIPARKKGWDNASLTEQEDTKTHSDKAKIKRQADRKVFDSRRRLKISAVAPWLKQTGYAVRGISSQLFKKPQTELCKIPAGHGGIALFQGKKVGAYRAEDGKTYLVSVRCPHLGCELSWNAQEKSWDCPCHGSRFDYRGNLLDCPACASLPGIMIESAGQMTP